MTEPATIRMIGERRMQCKDIADDEFLAAVLRTTAFDGTPLEPHAWRSRWAVQAELEKVIGPVPENLFLAKARRLGNRGLLGGCTSCSCTGRYHIAAACRLYGCCGMDTRDVQDQPSSEGSSAE